MACMLENGFKVESVAIEEIIKLLTDKSSNDETTVYAHEDEISMATKSKDNKFACKVMEHYSF